MEEVRTEDILIRDVETKNIMTKSNLPVGGYSVNPYVGCTHACKYGKRDKDTGISGIRGIIYADQGSLKKDRDEPERLRDRAD